MKMIKMDQGLFKIIYETLCYTRTIPDKRKVKKKKQSNLYWPNENNENNNKTTSRNDWK